MVVMTLQAAIPGTEIHDIINARMLWVRLYSWYYKFHFGSGLKIINLE